MGKWLYPDLVCFWMGGSWMGLNRMDFRSDEESLIQSRESQLSLHIKITWRFLKNLMLGSLPRNLSNWGYGLGIDSSFDSQDWELLITNKKKCFLEMSPGQGSQSSTRHLSRPTHIHGFYVALSMSSLLAWPHSFWLFLTFRKIDSRSI